LATFSEPDSFLYGGPDAISWFVAGVQKTNWFSLVPVSVRQQGTFGFDASNVTASLNRSGDYILGGWFQCDVPNVQWKTDSTSVDTDGVRWTRNLMHNLIREVKLTFNDLEVQKFDNYWLDFNAAFHVEAGEMPAYKQLIGDVESMTENLPGDQRTVNTEASLPGGQFAVPLPFFFNGDPGVALPVSALPFNDVKIQYDFRKVEDLLVFTGAVGSATSIYSNIIMRSPALSTTSGTALNSTTAVTDFTNAQTWINYAVVYQEERVMMGAAPRDILIKQNQIAQIKGSSSASTTSINTDLRFSHPVCGLYFALRNTTYPSEWSNYTTNVNYGCEYATVSTPQGGGTATRFAAFHDPVGASVLKYENTDRHKADGIVTSKLSPFTRGSTMPTDKGYHAIYYSLNDSATEGSGSTDYSRLNNVNLELFYSAPAQFYLANTLPDTSTYALGSTGAAANLSFSMIVRAQNWNIGRVSGGTWSFINF